MEKIKSKKRKTKNRLVWGECYSQQCIMFNLVYLHRHDYIMIAARRKHNDTIDGNQVKDIAALAALSGSLKARSRMGDPQVSYKLRGTT